MYKLPKEVIEALVKLGLPEDEISDVKNIDVGFYNRDKITNQDYVTYALYTDEDFKVDDILEFTVKNNNYTIKQNSDELVQGKCKFEFDEDEEIAIGDLHTVE